jgi:hypothetical protein
VPGLVDKYENDSKGLLVRGLLIENMKELPDTTTFAKSIKNGKLKVFGELIYPSETLKMLLSFQKNRSRISFTIMP